MFNTGQITLPKKWREKHKADKFIAEETAEGLLIKPIQKDETVYYESRNGFGIYSEKGLDINKFIKAIEIIEKEDGKIPKTNQEITTRKKKTNN